MQELLNLYLNHVMLIEITTKQCTTCKETKSLFAFDKNQLGKLGLSAECKACKAIRARKNYLARCDTKYWQGREQGISQEEYLKIFDTQKGCCAICTKILDNPKTTHLDHDHNTGKVRQFLCHQCNIGLGMFNDSIDYLTKAIGYIKFHSLTSIQDNLNGSALLTSPEIA